MMQYRRRPQKESSLLLQLEMIALMLSFTHQQVQLEKTYTLFSALITLIHFAISAIMEVW
jgi:hypothetical protein